MHVHVLLKIGDPRWRTLHKCDVLYGGPEMCAICDMGRGSKLVQNSL